MIEHKYFLDESKKQKYPDVLEIYKLNPMINIIFNGELSLEGFCNLYIKSIAGNPDSLFDRPKYEFYDYETMDRFLEHAKESIYKYFEVDKFDKSFQLKLKKDIKVYRVGKDADGHFRGYTSTSLKSYIPYQFLSSDRIYYIITVPKGIPYIYLEMEKGRDNEIAEFQYEYEILLPRGCTYDVTRSFQKTIKNPHFESEKANPSITIEIQHITITGVKPVPPKIKLIF